MVYETLFDLNLHVEQDVLSDDRAACLNKLIRGCGHKLFRTWELKSRPWAGRQIVQTR